MILIQILTLIHLNEVDVSADPDTLTEWDSETDADSLNEVDVSADSDTRSLSGILRPTLIHLGMLTLLLIPRRSRSWTFSSDSRKRSLIGIGIPETTHSRMWTFLLIQKHLLIEIQTRTLDAIRSRMWMFLLIQTRSLIGMLIQNLKQIPLREVDTSSGF